jgi:hypothetical protein
MGISSYFFDDVILCDIYATRRRRFLRIFLERGLKPALAEREVVLQLCS